MRFTANVAGTITELRYFRGAADAGDTDTRVLNLWNAAGVLLGSVTVTSAAGESDWQVGTLSAPIAIVAGATYVVSYGTTQNYATTANYFTTAHSGPDGVLTAAAGVFATGPGAFPTASYNATNYWADVTFVPTIATNSAPVITSGVAFTSPENRSLVTTITATDANANPLSYAIAGGADAALFTIDAQTGLLRFVSNPNYEAPADADANNVYDLTVSVSDGIAPPVTQAITVSVTDRAENGSGSSVFNSTDEPPTIVTTDQGDYELGMRFTASAAGSITELRYFRGAADANDTDTRVLNLWNAAGVLLGSVTVSSTPGESGWQVGALSAPIAIVAGETYVVSYGTTQNYAATANYFNTAHSGPDGVLTAGVASGVFAAGAPGAFPTASYNATNYWADVTFVPTIVNNSAPVITSGAAFTSPENQLIVRTITATDANANALTYAIADGADAALFTIDAQTGLLRFVSAPDYEAPADAGANNVYDLTVSVSDGIAPAVNQAITVSVTDRAEDGIGTNVFGATDEPTTTVTTDPADYELGMRFTANVAGIIIELRYFRGAPDAADTDTRVLNLWNAAGVKLGSVTVTSTAGEAGWQVGTLSAPIAIEAGATYVVSYGTTQNYTTTANYFNTAHSGPDGVLTAGVASGVFAAGTSIFPTVSHEASNYWTDVTFIPASEPAVLSSATVDLSETEAVLTTGGTLTISDVDSPATFVAQAGTAGSYGTFTIDAAGVWSYTASSAHDAFVAGTTYSDTFQVASADRTTTSVTVNIIGTNDAAVLSSATVGLSETDAVLTTGGTLTISDVDSPATFVAQAGTAGSYGTFTIDAAGVWTYTANSAHDAFVGGTTYSDTFQVASADGTTTSVTVNILGTNDAAVLSSATVGLSETNAVLTTGGTLTISDVDSPATLRGAGRDGGELRHLHDRCGGGVELHGELGARRVRWRDDLQRHVPGGECRRHDDVGDGEHSGHQRRGGAVVGDGWPQRNQRGADDGRDADDQRRRQSGNLRGAGRDGGELRHLHDRCGGGVELHGELGPRRVRWRDDLQRHVPGVECRRHDDVGDGEHSGHQRHGGAVVGDGWPQRNQRGARRRAGR